MNCGMGAGCCDASSGGIVAVVADTVETEDGGTSGCCDVSVGCGCDCCCSLWLWFVEIPPGDSVEDVEEDEDVLLGGTEKVSGLFVVC